MQFLRNISYKMLVDQLVTVDIFLLIYSSILVFT